MSESSPKVKLHQAIFETMQILTTIPAMRTACKGARIATNKPDSTLALVPTMGAIHLGHLSLVAAARAASDIVAASIFVNPLQFGPAEDFTRYPRTFEDDCRQLEAAGVDLLFAPDAAELTPANATTFVEVGGIGDRLDGISRPGHFRGISTIVAKLFHIVAPDIACFGQKDAAQVAVLRAMVRDLNFPVRLKICPTVREPDGLAMSSRNRYLTPAERTTALAISRGISAGAKLAAQGETRAESLQQTISTMLGNTPGLRVDYSAVVHPDTLEAVESIRDGALLAVAAWVGQTRLIDNLRLEADVFTHD